MDDHDNDWIAARYVLSSILGRNPFVVDRDDDDDFPVSTTPPAANGRGSRAECRLPTPVRATEGVAGTVCAVCTEEVAVGDAVVRLPCAHWYHAGCIAPWLGIGRTTCPVCRADLLLCKDGGGGVGGCEKPFARRGVVGGGSTSVSGVRRDTSYEYPAAGSILLG